jgi:hypothetical protein
MHIYGVFFLCHSFFGALCTVLHLLSHSWPRSVRGSVRFFHALDLFSLSLCACALTPFKIYVATPPQHPKFIYVSQSSFTLYCTKDTHSLRGLAVGVTRLRDFKLYLLVYI